MSEIKTKIRTYNDVIDLFGEEKAADMLSEALDWSTIDPKNDKKNIMERKPLLLDPYMTYEGEDYCKHIVAGFLGDRDLDWASGYIDEEKIKNGQVMPADLKSALSMALDNELSTSWAYLDALSSQCAEIFNKFAGYIESAGLARGVLVPGEYELDHDALNADVSERFNIQYGFQFDQMIDAMQFDMTLILTEKVDSMDGYRLIQSVCDWREENLEVIEDAENNLDYGKVPSYVAYERPADIGTTIIDELCASQGTAVEKLVNYPTTKFERTMRDELFEALAVNETTISLMAKVPSSVFLDAVACMDSRYITGTCKERSRSQARCMCHKRRSSRQPKHGNPRWQEYGKGIADYGIQRHQDSRRAGKLVCGEGRYPRGSCPRLCRTIRQRIPPGFPRLRFRRTLVRYPSF